MALTHQQQHRIRVALERANNTALYADEATQARITQEALTDATGDLPVADVVAFLREYSGEMMQEQLRFNRVGKAMEAIFTAIEAEGLDTPNDLLRVRGLTTVPELLASFGFTGDLEGLAREIEQSLSVRH